MHNKCGRAKSLRIKLALAVTCRGIESESISIDELCPTQSHISPRKRLVEYPVISNAVSQWRKPSAAYLRLKKNIVLTRCFHRPNVFCGQLQNVVYCTRTTKYTSYQFVLSFPDTKRSFLNVRSSPYLSRAYLFALN